MTTTHNGVPPVPAVDEPTDDAVAAGLAQALRAVRLGRFDTRLPRGLSREVVEEFDALVGLLERRNRDLLRIGRVVGREGRMLERLNEEAYDGAWAEGVHAVNALIDDLGQSAAETARVIEAVAQGDLSQHMALEIAGRPLRGEFLRIGRTVNTMVDQLSSFADEVTRVAREVGIDGRLGGQAAVRGVSGTWRDLTDSVNTMASNLTDQVRSISSAATAIAQGDLSRKITVSARGEVAELAETINALTDTLRRFADEVTRVAREVGTDGRLGGQAAVPNVAGTWKDLTDAVNLMAANLTAQVRGIAQVATAVATGDLSQKITVDARGEILELKDTVNTMVDQLSVVRRRGDARGARGRHRGQPRRPGPGPRRRRHLARPHRQRQLDGQQPDRSGAQHRAGDDGGGAGRPVAEDHRGCARGDPGAQEHRQHDGGPALQLRRRGDPRGPRGGHRGQPRAVRRRCRASRGRGGT